MGSATVEITGMDKVEKLIAKHLEENSKKIAMQIAKDAKASAAFKDQSGKLRKSIKTKKSKYPDGGHIVKAGGKGARQAFLVEYGHGGKKPAPPHPFLRPALDKNLGDAKRIFGVRQ